MTLEDRVARAGFALACLLFVLALPWPRAPLPGCPLPREAEAQSGHTSVVRCDGVGPPLRGPARLLFGLRLDPNRADARALEVLPGIGPARAAAIVAERERAPFRELAQLRRVKGIGPVTLRRISPFLEVRAALQENR